MDGTLCGRVEQSPSGNLTFRYAPEYPSGPDALFGGEKIGQMISILRSIENHAKVS
ncbi:hypothetical protein LFT48_19440 [Arthrobacter sp. FW305-123]|nr:hypothetical protein LFT48_19440 [Arthrobacter sp. FW305-123]